MRRLRPRNSHPSIIMDALDLSTNFRGYGWNWSHGLYVPQQTRPTNRIPFAFRAFLSITRHACICVVIHRAILSFIRVGSITHGFTIFDDTLPFIPRHIRASVFSALTATMSYAAMQMSYDALATLAVLCLGQDPAQWPPAFDAPWRATSLADFWGHRWHQWNRRMLLFLGGYPLGVVFGNTGVVLGAFLASALTHDVMLVALERRVEAWAMLAGFGMMGPGILAERAFWWWTGKRVGGVVGWLWTMGWLLLWGNIMFDAFARAGGLDDWSPIAGTVPLGLLVERLVHTFDSWLHAMG